MPDVMPTSDFSFTLPRAGAVLVDFFDRGRGVTCTAGQGRAGVYLDGVPVSGTSVAIGTFSDLSDLSDIASSAVVAMTAGGHTLRIGMDCPAGDASIPIPGSGATWSVTLLN